MGNKKPVYNTICHDFDDKFELLNPFGEFIDFCDTKYGNMFGTEKSIDNLCDREDFEDRFPKMISCINNMSVKKIKDIERGVSYGISISSNGDFIGSVDFYKHTPYDTVTGYPSDVRRSACLRLDKMEEWRKINVAPRKSEFIFDDCSVPGTLNVFLAMILGVSDMYPFFRDYKVKRMRANNINAYMRNISESMDGSDYLCSYGPDKFSVSVTDKNGRMYIASYGYENYMESLIKFNKSLRKCL